jgi:hypothetical protein
MGVRDEEFDATAADVRRAVDGLGDLVDSLHHQLPSVPTTHERIFAQFASRCQVDLVVFPASVPGGSVPHVVVLYDPGHLLTVADERHPVTPGQIREWAFQGWCALADLGKYLRRQSAWEALDRLNAARAQLWQLWAVAHDVPEPQYGLTSILDFAPGSVPPGMAATVADLDPARLLSAARHLAALLSGIGRHLPPDQRAALPNAMARYVTADLAALPLTDPGSRGRAHGPAGVKVVEATREEGRAMLDRAAREVLKISGEELLARWDAGDYEDADDPAVTRVAMLIPFAR